MEAFSWLIDDWDRLRRAGRVLDYNMSSIEAWKCFRKPSRFIDHDMRFVLRDDFKEAALNAYPGRSTAFLREVFDHMDEDRSGVIRMNEFKQRWSNVKVQILTTME